MSMNSGIFAKWAGPAKQTFTSDGLDIESISARMYERGFVHRSLSKETAIPDAVIHMIVEYTGPSHEVELRKISRLDFRDEVTLLNSVSAKRADKLALSILHRFADAAGYPWPVISEKREYGGVACDVRALADDRFKRIVALLRSIKTYDDWEEVAANKLVADVVYKIILLGWSCPAGEKIDL